MHVLCKVFPLPTLSLLHEAVELITNSSEFSGFVLKDHVARQANETDSTKTETNNVMARMPIARRAEAKDLSHSA